jgi:hypothetical protein
MVSFIGNSSPAVEQLVHPALRRSTSKTVMPDENISDKI